MYSRNNICTFLDLHCCIYYGLFDMVFLLIYKLKQLSSHFKRLFSFLCFCTACHLSYLKVKVAKHSFQEPMPNSP